MTQRLRAFVTTCHETIVTKDKDTCQVRNRIVSFSYDHTPFQMATPQIVQKEVDRPTRLLQFVAFVHLPFSFRSLDLFVASLLFRKGTSFSVIRGK